MPNDAALEPLLHAQESVISREQALRAGLSRRAVEHRLATRAWQRVLPSVNVVGLRLPEDEDEVKPLTRMQSFRKRLGELWTSVAGI